MNGFPSAQPGKVKLNVGAWSVTRPVFKSLSAFARERGYARERAFT
jgi:hypothetical protein